jgi:hypothetical protein
MAITKATASSIAPAAKGDLVVGSATNDAAVLGVGTNDQVLTADSSTTTGLKWAAASGTTYSYDLINAGGTALTGASTITVSGISGKNFIAVVVDGASSVNGSSQIGLRFNSDSTSKYGQSGTYQRDSDSIRGYLTSYNGGTLFEVGTITSTSTSAVTSTLSFTGTAGTGAKIATIISYITQPGGSGTFVNPITTGIYTGSSAVTSVSLISSSGNFDAGTLYVYGA